MGRGQHSDRPVSNNYLNGMRYDFDIKVGPETNFTQPEGLLPSSYSYEREFNDYVNQEHRNRLAWPGDSSGWPASDSDPYSRAVAEYLPGYPMQGLGIGALSGSSSMPDIYGQQQETPFSTGIPPMGSIPGFLYTDPSTGNLVDMSPTQASYSRTYPTGEVVETTADYYTFPDGTTVGSLPVGWKG